MVKKGLFEPFLSIFYYQAFRYEKSALDMKNHANKGPKNKLRVESFRKYLKKTIPV